MPAGFRRHLVGKTVVNVFHCDIAEIRFVGKLVTIRHFINQRTECYLNYRINLRPPSYTHYAMLYPQNGDRIMAIDSVTSLHPMYSLLCVKFELPVFLFQEVDQRIWGPIRKLDITNVKVKAE